MQIDHFLPEAVTLSFSLIYIKSLSPRHLLEFPSWDDPHPLCSQSSQPGLEAQPLTTPCTQSAH